MFISSHQIETPTIYQLLTNAVVPRPIAWVSTIDENGVSNLAPYSFFSVASVNPPVLTITTVPARDKLQKDTLHNLLQTQDAVVHIVTEDLLDEMNASCADYPAGTSEIATLNLPTVASELVTAPSLANCKIRYECKLRETVEVASHPGGGILVLLDVVGTFVDDSLLTDGKLDAGKFNVFGKLGANDYSDTEVKATLARPEL